MDGLDLTNDHPFQKISLRLINARPASCSPEQIDSLRESLGAIGLLHPLTVAKVGARYDLLAGASRYAAHQELGLKDAWCLVFPHKPASLGAELAFIDENLQRSKMPAAQEDALRLRRDDVIASLRPDTASTAAASARAAAAGKKGGRPKKPKGNGKSGKNPAAKSAAGLSRTQREHESPHSTAVVAVTLRWLHVPFGSPVAAPATPPHPSGRRTRRSSSPASR